VRRLPAPVQKYKTKKAKMAASYKIAADQDAIA
jgi:hypothetical protein